MSESLVGGENEYNSEVLRNVFVLFHGILTAVNAAVPFTCSLTGATGTGKQQLITL